MARTEHEYDLIIRGGTVYDGTGADGVVADVGVTDGRIARMGSIDGTGAEEIDARGKIVTPGFVDIHTHYDGQAVWSDQLAPSSWNGVTTVVMGNCGVGFAPCRPDDRQRLIALMEGVEDIPGAVMDAGLTWEWESFPEFLDALEIRQRDIDICALVPHAPLRVFAMGDRALRLEPATAADVAQMRELLADAIRAGAFGVSTSRTTAHRAVSGDMTPTLLAREREITALMMGMADAGRGLFELVTEASDPDCIGDFQMVRRALEASGRAAVFTMIQSGEQPELWRTLSAFADQAIADGVSLRPVVAPRPIGMLLGLEGSQNPFAGAATYAAISTMPLAERVARMRDPEVRRQILSEDRLEFSTFPFMIRIPWSNMFLSDDMPDYAPTADTSIEAVALRSGRDPAEVAYDALLEHDGLAFIYVPFANFASGDLRVCEEMLSNPNNIMGLGDGGAHVGFILDAGFQTWLLTHWVRDTQRFSVAEAVRRMTSDTADVMGLSDRGRIAENLRADLNVINIDALELAAPYVEYDLPNGGKRLLQKAVGYEATIVAGQVTYRNGIATGAKPGRLVRSGALVAV